MNRDVARKITNIAVGLWAAGPGDNPVPALLQIIATAREAYEDHTGKPLDPSLIRAEAPLESDSEERGKE